MHRPVASRAILVLTASLAYAAHARAQTGPDAGVPAPLLDAPPAATPPADATVTNATTDAPGEPAQTATNTPASVPVAGGIATVPPVSTPPPPPRSAPAPPLFRLPAFLDGFSFGSYGRVIAATDLAGHVADRTANIVSHGTRIDESTYAELELHRDDTFGHVRTRMVATLGILGPLFHDTGTFDIHMAVRNLYIEERGAFAPGLAVWVGSRMYRGDDIYLLDFWPLDNLNTVGGGARYDLGDHLTFAAHVGSNRLDNLYQYQAVNVVPRDGIGAVTVSLLDRPRFIESLKATWWLNGRSARTGIKVALYGEAHELPGGVRQNTDTGSNEALPADGGWVMGGEVGAYAEHNTFLNVFFRYSSGLGAYGDLQVPYTLTATQTSQRARDVLVAFSGNFERGPFALLAGGYLRYFQDADPAVFGRNDMLEGTLVLRPTIWIGNHFGLAAEGSYQALEYNMVDPVTGVGPRGGSLWRFGLVPFISPAGRGSFTRPHLRLIYAVTVRDAGAQRLYPPDDPFAHNGVVQFLGLGCEWWFNSSYL